MSTCVVPALIGLRKEDPALAAFLRDIAHPAQHDEFAGLKIEHVPQDGLSLYFDARDRLTSVFLYSGRTADGSRYGGPLPEGVSFEFGRGDALLKFGHPEKSGPDWGRFVRDGRVIHFWYADSRASLAIITVFAWDREGGAQLGGTASLGSRSPRITLSLGKGKRLQARLRIPERGHYALKPKGNR